MYVLDTDVVSNQRLARPDPAVRAWLHSIPPLETCISVATVAELVRGAEMAQRAGHHQAARLVEWVRQVIGSAQVLSLDAGAAELLGKLWATPALNNFVATSPGARAKKSGADLIVAAIAIRHDSVIATGNLSDYAQIGRHWPQLKALNPWTGERVNQG